MFFCNGCGQTFEECKVVKEHRPYGMGTATEDFAVCPFCDYSDIDEAEKCQRCGEYGSEFQEGLCDVCYGDMYGE